MSEFDSDFCDCNESRMNDKYPYFKQLIQEKENPTDIDLLSAKNESCNERKLGKKHGRKKKNNQNELSNHTSKHRDNVLKKIKVHFHKYIISWLNRKLLKKKIRLKFSNFFQDFQNDITISTNRLLLNLKLSQILVKIITCKGNGPPNKNEIVYNQIKDEKDLKELFSLTYKELYLQFLNSKEAKNLIDKERKKNNDIRKILKNFIDNFSKKQPKIPKKYKNEIIEKIKPNLTYELLFGNKNKLLTNLLLRKISNLPYLLYK